MNRLKSYARALRGRLLGTDMARNTVWMFLGLSSRTLIQAGYFVVIARSLSADGYGAFVGVAALVGVGIPFASWGTGQILIQDVARDPARFRRCWGNALLMTLLSGLLLTGAAVAIGSLLLPPSISLPLVLSVALADLLFARLTDVASQAFWAFERLQRTAAIAVWLSVARLAAALGMVWLIPSPTPEHWGIGFLLSSIAAALVAVVLVHRELGAPQFAPRDLTSRLREGFYFAVGQSAFGVHNDIDKTLLTRLATLQAAGIYGAAYRIIDVAFTPLLSMLMASYTQFFRSGAKGIRGALRLARRLLPKGAAYGLVAGVGLYASAPLLPYLLGEEYGDSAAAIRWLAVLPLLRLVQALGGDILTGTGRQGLRSTITILVAVCNVLLNLWLIPRFSWLGAAWASLASDMLMVALMWSAVLYARSTERSGAPEPAALTAQA